jgi:hypothetical protein
MYICMYVCNSSSWTPALYRSTYQQQQQNTMTQRLGYCKQMKKNVKKITCIDWERKKCVRVRERERERVWVCVRERERMFANAVVVCLDEGKTWKSGTGKMAICWLLGFRVAARLMATARRWRLRKAGLLVPNWRFEKIALQWLSSWTTRSGTCMFSFISLLLFCLTHFQFVKCMYLLA